MARNRVSTVHIRQPIMFSVYRTAALNSSNSETAVAFDTSLYDIGGNVDLTTNKGRFTAPIAGYYRFAGTVGNSAATSTAVYTVLAKNGVSVKAGTVNTSTLAPTYSHASGTIQLAAGDYVELKFVGGNGSVISVGAQNCWFEGELRSTM